MAAFARQRGLSPPRLYYWKKRLGTPTSLAARTTIALVPARLKTETAPAEIAIRLPNGIAIEAVAASPHWIAMVVAELTRLLP